MFQSTTLNSIIFFIFCSVMILWILESKGPRFIISVHNEPSVNEMIRIIQEQRQKIEYLSTHPKIVFHCPDDESKIKYPRKASDELTEIAMNTNDECGNDSDIDAVMIVHTAAHHFPRRERFRRLYSNYSNTKPYKLKVVFLIGSVLDANLQIELERENRDYGDTVVGAFLDTYQNLTLKAVMGFRWLANTCPKVKLLIKMDDDVFFDVRKFFAEYWLPMPNWRKRNSIHCYVWHNALVGRTGKWKVEKGLFAESSYPFPYCAGLFVIVTPDLIRSIYNHSKNIDFFWIDDVFLYGMVPAAIKGVNFVQAGDKKKGIVQWYTDYKKCRETLGRDGCKMWGTLTDGEGQFDTEYSALVYPPSSTTPHSKQSQEKEDPKSQNNTKSTDSQKTENYFKSQGNNKIDLQKTQDNPKEQDNKVSLNNQKTEENQKSQDHQKTEDNQKTKENKKTEDHQKTEENHKTEDHQKSQKAEKDPPHTDNIESNQHKHLSNGKENNHKTENTQHNEPSGKRRKVI